MPTYHYNKTLVVTGDVGKFLDDVSNSYEENAKFFEAGLKRALRSGVLEDLKETVEEYRKLGRGEIDTIGPTPVTSPSYSVVYHRQGDELKIRFYISPKITTKSLFLLGENIEETGNIALMTTHRKIAELDEDLGPIEVPDYLPKEERPTEIPA